MNYEFESPDRFMVGARGEVGDRLFLLQVREGRRLAVIKCEKQQLSALATWLAAVLEAVGRPGELPTDLSLEAEYEPDFTAGEIAVGVDQDRGVLDLVITATDEGSTLSATLSKEWAGALAIEITRLVDAGRSPCPLCGYPLDDRGHDCPRTNGHTAPRR